MFGEGEGLPLLVEVPHTSIFTLKDLDIIKDTINCKHVFKRTVETLVRKDLHCWVVLRISVTVCSAKFR